MAKLFGAECGACSLLAILSCPVWTGKEASDGGPRMARGSLRSGYC